MENFGFKEMQCMQKELQEKYKDWWPSYEPENGKNQMLWLMIELGEAADVMKKQGNQKILEDKEVREHFVEEMCDILMYFNDVMLCYDISADELEEVYLAKHKKNMERW